MRRVIVLSVAVTFIASCGGGPTTDVLSTAESVSPSTAVATSTTQSAPTTTVAPATMRTEATTTTVEVINPDDPAAATWVGLRFSAGVNLGWVDGEYRRLDTWREDSEALLNVGHWSVRIIVDGHPTDLWPWHEGSYGGGRPVTELLIVGTEPNPYSPGEYEQEIEGVQGHAPDPSTQHQLAVWAVREHQPGRYVITDVARLTRTGQNMGYGALVNVLRQYDLCTVDASVTDAIYAYFDHEHPEMEELYPATTAYSVSDDGEIKSVGGNLVSCILEPDWETRGY